jgi:hypothetical protein
MTDNKQVEQIESELVEEILRKFEEIGIDTSNWEYEFGDGNFAAEFIQAGIRSHLEKLNSQQNVQVSDTTGDAQSGEADNQLRFANFFMHKEYNAHTIMAFAESETKYLESQLREAREEIEEYSRNLKNAVNTGEHWCNKWAEVNAKNYDLEEQLKNLSQQPQEIVKVAQPFFDWVKKYYPLVDTSDEKAAKLYMAYHNLKSALTESTPQTPNKQNS